MNKSDPELSDWYMSLEKEFLLECPKCNYVFPDTATIVFGKHSGLVKCRRCAAQVKWEEKSIFVCEVEDHMTRLKTT